MWCDEIMIPPYFKCPISLDLFKDPVTLWTGQTYDRSCIEKWLAAGNSTCPVTMQKLHDSSMVPNHTLRHLIDDWLRSNGYSSTECSLDDFSEDEIFIARIKHIIESDAFASEQKIRALEEVHSLSQELPLKNSILITLNFFQTLIEKVFRNGESLMLVEKSLSSALKLMPFSELKCLNILKQESENAVFLSHLEEGTVFIKKALCLIVEAISSERQTIHLCEKLGESSRGVRAFVRIVEQREQDEEAVEAGIRALLALSSIESNLANIASHGAVEALVACLSEVEGRKGSVAVVAMSAIERLLPETSAKRVLLNHPEGVRGVVKMVFRVSEHEGSESAVNSLLILCADCEIVMEKVIGEGVLTQLLLLLQSQSSARTKTKGRMLLNMLRSK